MATDPPDESLGVVAVDEEQLEGVHHNSDELDLKQRHELLSGTFMWSASSPHLVVSRMTPHYSAKPQTDDYRPDSKVLHQFAIRFIRNRIRNFNSISINLI